MRRIALESMGQPEEPALYPHLPPEADPRLIKSLPQMLSMASLMKVAGSLGFYRPRIMTSELLRTQSSIQSTLRHYDSACAQAPCPTLFVL
ncbi:SQSTM1 [Lemmus lemmus]